MSNIAISKNVKRKFKEYRKQTESIDEALLRLFDEANVEMYDSDDGMTSIMFDADNLDRLKSFRAYKTETYSSVILRLLESVEKED